MMQLCANSGSMHDLFVQGWLKSTRNSYLNTGFFPRNLIWICGVLKKSIFAYLKFNICIPSKFSGILRFFYCSLHLTSVLFAPLPYVWLNHHFSWLGNNCLKWTWRLSRTHVALSLTQSKCALSLKYTISSNLGWNGIWFTMVTGVRHREHPKIPYMNTSSLEIS